jgi:hypothetical protein
VKKANQKFVLKKCTAAKGANSKPAKTVKVNMINDTGGMINLTLSGPATYRLTIQTGKSQIFVMKGRYSYTVYGICGTKSGTINIRGNTRWRWWCY